METNNGGGGYHDMIVEYPQRLEAGELDTEYLYKLSYATALATLKKIYQASGNDKIRRMRIGLIQDVKILQKIDISGYRAYRLRNNRNGRLVREIVDKTAAKIFSESLDYMLSDGMDVMQDACVAILEHGRRSDAGKCPEDLETPYKIRRIDRRVKILSKDSFKWKKVQTTPIQEIFRYIRRQIYSIGSVEIDPKSGYLYLEQIISNPDTGEKEKVYQRTSVRFADIGGSDTAFRVSTGHRHKGHASGPVAYTAVQAGFRSELHLTEIVDSLNLSPGEAEVLKYRLKGFGNRAIAAKKGVKVQTVYRMRKRIQEKALKHGLKPSADMTDKFKDERAAVKTAEKRKARIDSKAAAAAIMPVAFPGWMKQAETEDEKNRREASRLERERRERYYRRRVEAYQNIYIYIRRWYNAVNGPSVKLIETDTNKNIKSGGRCLYASSASIGFWRIRHIYRHIV